MDGIVDGKVGFGEDRTVKINFIFYILVRRSMHYPITKFDSMAYRSLFFLAKVTIL